MPPGNPERPAPRLRYGEFLSAERVKQRLVSYNAAYAKTPRHDRHMAPRLRLIDLHRLFTPYVSVRFFEQARALRRCWTPRRAICSILPRKAGSIGA